MRYCIGCKHLEYTNKCMGAGSTGTGSYTIEDASMLCAKKHWQQYLSEYRSLFPFAKAMEHAENCNDFEERPTE